MEKKRKEKKGFSINNYYMLGFEIDHLGNAVS